MNYLLNIRTKLRELRKNSGFTQAQFAEMFSISNGYLSEIEHGKKSIPIELLIAVMEKFEISPNEFFMYPDLAYIDTLIEKRLDEILQKRGLV